jgi:hypothetical protein
MRSINKLIRRTYGQKQFSVLREILFTLNMPFSGRIN